MIFTPPPSQQVPVQYPIAAQVERIARVDDPDEKKKNKKAKNETSTDR